MRCTHLVDIRIYTRESTCIQIWDLGSSQINRELGRLVDNSCLLTSTHKLSTSTLPWKWCYSIYVLNY